jgi:predicted porin
MKKSLIALAALGAFAGAASAQSSVTLYGLVDVNYQYIKAGDSATLGTAAGTNIHKLADGNDWGPGSRWGLRVAEDLGSGLKANVVLESGFTADTGASAQNGRLFGRQAFVSLASASLGEVRLGRQYTLHDEVQVLNNPFGNATILNPGGGGGYATTGSLAAPASRLPLFIDAVRQDNAVQYISPSFAGFRVQGMVAAGEGVQDRYQGVKGVYANGPLNVALSYEQSHARVPVGGLSNVNKIVELGGNYDFGVAKVFAGFQQGKDLTTGSSAVAGGGNGSQIGTLTIPAVGGVGFTANKLRAYTVGASVPFGAITLAANYTAAKYENGGLDRDLGRFGIGATYALSKLTTLYTAYGQATGDLKNAVLEKRVFQLGLRKAF